MKTLPLHKAHSITVLSSHVRIEKCLWPCHLLSLDLAPVTTVALDYAASESSSFNESQTR